MGLRSLSVVETILITGPLLWPTLYYYVSIYKKVFIESVMSLNILCLHVLVSVSEIPSIDFFSLIAQKWSNFCGLLTRTCIRSPKNPPTHICVVSSSSHPYLTSSQLPSFLTCTPFPLLSIFNSQLSWSMCLSYCTYLVLPPSTLLHTLQTFIRVRDPFNRSQVNHINI